MTLTHANEIQRFTLVALRGALRLEIAGMKKRGQSALSIARSKGYKGDRAAIVEQITAELTVKK